MARLRKYTRNVRSDPEYTVWKWLRARVLDPNHTSYHRYGGRGITVAAEFDSYEVFLTDVGRRPSPNHWIERKNNELGYAPGNVAWSTPSEQCRNTRRNRVLTFNGEQRSLIEWCEILGLPYSTIRSRLRGGWGAEAALTTPVRTGNYKRKEDYVNHK